MSQIQIPKTHRVIRRTPPSDQHGKPSLTSPSPLRIVEEPTPTLTTPTSVLIRIRAVALNYRDTLTLRGHEAYPGVFADDGVPTSDCAAEVVAVGEGVTRFSVGDRVCPTFDLLNLDGRLPPPASTSGAGSGSGSYDYLGKGLERAALGGEVDGVLREWAVFEEKVLVRLPRGLSWEEAATISCAGITAWNALGAPASFENAKDKTVLLQGTGGVSMFALLISLAAGFKPIITSSSDEKLASLRADLKRPDLLGYNYRTHPDQVAMVKQLTDNRGVDFVVNNNGLSGIPADINSLVAMSGTVSMVGFLAGMAADWSPQVLFALMGKVARLQGVAVGSRDDFEALNRFLEEKNVSLAPLVDSRIFDFADSQAAFDHLWSGKHVGKVVIRL